MAINYTKIGWDTSKYVNPTNMNQMDDGIKAACDAIDSEVLKLTNDALPTIANTASGANAAISLKSNNVRSVADYRDQNGTALGMMGFDSNKKPTIYDVPANAWKEIALADNVIAKSSTLQTITNTNTGQYVAAMVKSSYAIPQTAVGFQDVNNSTLGYIGVNSGHTPFFVSGESNSSLQALVLAHSAGLTGTASSNIDISKVSVPALVLVANAGGGNNFAYALGMITETGGTRYYSQIAGSLTVTCSNSTLTIPSGYNYYKILQ